MHINHAITANTNTQILSKPVSIRGCMTRSRRIFGQRLYSPSSSVMLIKLYSQNGRDREWISHMTCDVNWDTFPTSIYIKRRQSSPRKGKGDGAENRNVHQFGSLPYREALRTDRGYAVGTGDMITLYAFNTHVQITICSYAMCTICHEGRFFSLPPWFANY